MVTDPSGLQASDQLILSIAAAPNSAPIVNNPIANQSNIQNSAWSYTFPSNAFYDANGDILTYTASGVPAGLSFNGGTRTFSGTPSAQGTYTVTVTANDGNGASVSDSFTITVNAPTNNPPVVSNPLLNRTATSDQFFSYTFASNSFTDPNGDTLTYTASGGPLSIGFNASTRTFSGVPFAFTTKCSRPNCHHNFYQTIGHKI